MRDLRTLEVRGKTFRISLINNWFANQYFKLENDLRGYETAALQAQIIQEEVRTGTKDPMEAAEAVNALADQIKGFKPDEFHRRQLDLVKELMESNDLEYDERWWERKTSPTDLTEFIRRAARLDQEDVKKKDGPAGK